MDQYKAGESPYECYDMVGNTWEWCSDWQGPEIGQSRVLRGGAWYSSHDMVCTTTRSQDKPASVHGSLGFRCCRSIRVAKEQEVVDKNGYPLKTA